MKKNQIAAQLYTVRDLCKSPGETADVLKEISAMGYAAVEVAGIGEFDPAAFRRVADDLGLKVCAFHDKMSAVLNEPEKVAEKASVLGCDYVVYSFPQGFDMTRKEDVEQLIRELKSAAPRYLAAGKTLCYHHHSLEFTRFGETIVLKHLLESIEPALLGFVLDTYWIQHGGGTPAKWCERLKGRFPVLHLKDFGNIAGTPTMMEVGRGNLEWAEIIKAASASGCRWFAVEQDTCPGSPLESLRISHDFLAEMCTA
jgi:sugar phosphate isomerase/epimerase